MKDPKTRPPPVQVAHLFPELLDHLLAVLADLDETQWSAPTPCPGWSVKDIAAHLLDVDLGNLSRQRDQFSASVIREPRWNEFVRLLNEKNQRWVETARGISSKLLGDLLRFTGGQAGDYFASLDPFDQGPVVSWAGPDPAPNWLNIAREYTERWHHQQQIREAVGKPRLTEPRFFAPVLATFARALPVAYANVEAPQGTTVKVRFVGDAGGDWFLVRRRTKWDLASVAEATPTTNVEMDQLDAWKLFTKGLESQEARGRSRIEGEATLASQLFSATAIIA
ncbi:MAG: maleylpyruvate isomerase family mycothiol-dependent enzyme [Dehalococcoidia bacterium]